MPTTKLVAAAGVLLGACGAPAPPVHPPVTAVAPTDPQDALAAKRLNAARSIVLPGTNCIQFDTYDQIGYDLGEVDHAAVLCAVDADPDRDLGPLACWNIDPTDGHL